MQRAIVHVGLHKTGTTSVQLWLESLMPWLRENGIAYIPLHAMRSDLTPLLTDLNDWKRRAARNFFDQVTSSTLIISDENIVGDTRDVLSGHIYPWARNRLEALFDSLSGLEIHLIVTLRNPSDLLAAFYAEHLRHYDFISFDDYVRGFPLEKFSYWRLFGWLADAPDNVRAHVLPFEEALGGGVVRVGETFIAAATGGAAVADTALLHARRVRTSFSAEEIELAGHIATHSNGRVARAFFEDLERLRARFGSTRFDPVPAATAAALAARYREDIERFADLL